MEDKEGESFFSLYCSLILPLLYRQMRRHFSPPQLPFSSLPIPPLPPTLRIPPPLPSPSYPSHLPRPSAPSHTITWLFFYSSTSFSIFPFFSSFFSSSHFTLPCMSFLLPLLFFPSPSCCFHLWSCHLSLRRRPPPSRSPGSPRRHSHLSLIFLLLPFSSSSSCTFCSSSSNSYSPSAPTGNVGCEKLKTLSALNQFTKPRYAHINIYLGQVDPRWGKLSRGTSCPKLCGSTCPIMTLVCPQ